MERCVFYCRQLALLITVTTGRSWPWSPNLAGYTPTSKKHKSPTAQSPQIFFLVWLTNADWTLKDSQESWNSNINIAEGLYRTQEEPRDKKKKLPAKYFPRLRRNDQNRAALSVSADAAAVAINFHFYFSQVMAHPHLNMKKKSWFEHTPMLVTSSVYENRLFSPFFPLCFRQ